LFKVMKVASVVRGALPCLLLLLLAGAGGCAEAQVISPDAVMAPGFLSDTDARPGRIDPVARPAPSPPSSSPVRAAQPPMAVASASRRRQPPTPAADANRACLRSLSELSVPFVVARPVRGLRTPVEIMGPIKGVGLVPRAARLPLMDCELARALAEVAPVLRQQGIIGLVFSGAYDYRTRRGSARLSAHAHGLAIDVHAISTRRGQLLDVAQDWPRLRTLADRLRQHPSVRYVITPDDNDDHHDHLHIEAYPGRPERLISVAAPGGRARRPAPRAR
jgi:hypothetical protein